MPRFGSRASIGLVTPLVERPSEGYPVALFRLLSALSEHSGSHLDSIGSINSGYRALIDVNRVPASPRKAGSSDRPSQTSQRTWRASPSSSPHGVDRLLTGALWARRVGVTTTLLTVGGPTIMLVRVGSVPNELP